MAMTEPTVDDLLDRIGKLLAAIANVDECRGCDQWIFWVKHKNGKMAPYTPQGLNHFIDCPKANEFRRKKP